MDATTNPLMIHEATGRTNALSNTWNMDYDANGNITAVTDPLGHKWAYGYDENNANGVVGLNNLSSITPPLDNTGATNPAKRVDIHYDNPNDPNDDLADTPTSPTRIVSPPAESGGPLATTFIEYGDAFAPSSWQNQVTQVTGPNGVVSRFEYDSFGQPSREIENPDAQAGQTFTPLTGGTPTVTNETSSNDGGILFAASHGIGACGCENAQSSLIEMDGCGQTTGVTCPQPCIQACEIPLAFAGTSSTPYFGQPLSSGCFSQQLSPNGLPTTINRCVQDPFGIESNQSRDLTITYDAFDRPLSITLNTAEPTGGGALITRSFANIYDDVAGTFTAIDQDGNTFTTTTDAAGRIATVTRVIAHPEIDPFAFTTITASYTYDAAGHVIRIDHGNGTAVVRQYDAANRLTLIRHEDVVGDAMLELAYTYSADGLVTRIIETDEVSEASFFPPPPGEPIPPIISQVDFEYDNRNRLTRETRDTVNNVVDIDLGTARYDLSYIYDAGGNRLSKTNNISGRVTTYTYDITETNDGDQHNNRLLAYDVTDTDPATGTPIAVEQTLYQYGPAGNVVKLVKRMDTTGDDLIDQADEFAAVWWFYYDTSNKLWLAVSGTGMFDEAAGTLSGTIFEKAAEYRYDGGRERYLVRQRDPDPNANWAILGTGQWRDYLGGDIYNDYAVDTAGTVSSGIGYLPSVGFDDPSLASAPAYYGGDLIGTSRRVTDSSTGAPPVVHRSVLTAFGEPTSSVGTGNTRYGYAGDWGYETPEQSFDPLTELGWLHVGERYYDPAVGRFMQRDPIGIRGGLNTYEYVRSNPTLNVDPLGLSGGGAGSIIVGATGGFGIGTIVGYGVCAGFTISTGGLGGLLIVGMAGTATAAAGGLIGQCPSVISQAATAAVAFAKFKVHQVVSPIQKAAIELDDAIHRFVFN